MKPLKLTILLLALTFTTSQVFAQAYYYNDDYYNTELLYEFGVGAGLMNCVTDIGGANTDNTMYFNEINGKNNHSSKSFYAGVLYKNFVGARLEATFGEISAQDSIITGKTLNLISKNIRNLSFKSKISEIALISEFYPLQLFYIEPIPFLSPYILAGVGYYHFNPQAKYDNKWIDLQPLHTEGEGFDEYPDRKPYKLSQLNIPLGLGIKYEVSGMFNLRVEFMHRRLFTDYLDDASQKEYVDPALFSKYLSPKNAEYARVLYNRTQDGSVPIFRGHSNNNDAYMTFSVKLGIVLGRERTGTSIGTKHLRCFF
jgi:hypothetical protein